MGRDFSQRNEAIKEKPLVCINCGATDDIQMHHVVPLIFGGSDCASNMVPLCCKCHNATHHAKNISEYIGTSQSGGRPPKCDDATAFSAMDMLANGEIGERRCQELMLLGHRTHVKMTSQYRKWKRMRGIKNVKNYFDVTATLSAKRMISESERIVVGFIEYDDGRKTDILYRKSHENDGIKYKYTTTGGLKNDVTWGEIKHIEASSKRRKTNAEVLQRLKEKVIEDEMSKISSQIYSMNIDKFGRVVIDEPKYEQSQFLATEGVKVPIQEAALRFEKSMRICC